MTAKSKKHLPAICRPEMGDVTNPRDYHRARDPGLTPKKGGFFAKAKDWLEGKSPADRTGPQRTPNGLNYPNNWPSHQPGGGARILLPAKDLETKDPRDQLSSLSNGDRSGSREADVSQLRGDDTGPSPQELVMAVMGVKSSVNHFATAIISDMTKFPEELEHLKQSIRGEVKAEVDRANHWKFLVQAFVCKRLFEGFDSANGFFGIVL